MFTIGLTILCAVFVIGYIFFGVAAEADNAPARTADVSAPSQQDAA